MCFFNHGLKLKLKSSNPAGADKYMCTQAVIGEGEIGVGMGVGVAVGIDQRQKSPYPVDIGCYPKHAASPSSGLLTHRANKVIDPPVTPLMPASFS